MKQNSLTLSDQVIFLLNILKVLSYGSFILFFSIVCFDMLITENCTYFKLSIYTFIYSLNVF